MFSGGEYDEVARWLRNFVASHAKRENLRVEPEVDTEGPREGQSYGVRLRLGAALSQQLGRAQPAGLSRLRPLHRLHRAGMMIAPGHAPMLPDRSSRRHSTYENLK